MRMNPKQVVFRPYLNAFMWCEVKVVVYKYSNVQLKSTKNKKIRKNTKLGRILAKRAYQ